MHFTHLLELNPCINLQQFCICCVCSPLHVMLGLQGDFHTLRGTSNIKTVNVQEARTMFDFKDINESCKSLTSSLGY